jgi:hypothetical protein
MNDFKQARGLLFLVLSIGMLSGCGNGAQSPSGTSLSSLFNKPLSVTDDVCADFPVDFMYSALGKPIVHLEPSTLESVHACQYYYEWKENWTSYQGQNLAGGRGVSIVLEDQVGTQRSRDNMVKLGLTLETDERIPGDHVIGKKSDGSIWDINLKVDEQRYIYISQLSGTLTNDEYIAIAGKIAERLYGKGSIDIKKNPVSVEQADENAGAVVVDTNTEDSTTPSESNSGSGSGGGGSMASATVVQSFFDALGSRNIDGALGMMDANADTKQGWGVNFASIDSLSVTSMSPMYPEDWTADREIYQVELDVKLKPNVQSWGWENGANTRWVSMKRVGENWVVHELANNP